MLTTQSLLCSFCYLVFDPLLAPSTPFPILLSMSLVFCLFILFHPHNGPVSQVKKLRTEEAFCRLTAGKQQGWKLNQHLPTPYSVHLLLHLLRPVLLVTKSQTQQQTRLTEPHPQAGETMLKSLLEPNPGSVSPELQDWVFFKQIQPQESERSPVPHTPASLWPDHMNQTVWLELDQPVKHIGLSVTHPAVQADIFKEAPEPSTHCAVELERDRATWVLATWQHSPYQSVLCARKVVSNWFPMSCPDLASHRYTGNHQQLPSRKWQQMNSYLNCYTPLIVQIKTKSCKDYRLYWEVIEANRETDTKWSSVITHANCLN